MTKFKNYREIVETVVQNLRHPDQARCWNIVIPPTFGAEKFSFDLCGSLETRLNGAMVARISADGLAAPLDLIRQVQHQWLPGHTAEVLPDSDPQILITRLLERAGEFRPKVIVVSEFHKMLGKLDERVLVAMRDAEQAGRLRTVTISVYPYQWIKERWKREGHLLHVSNYGDSHSELRATVAPYEEVVDAFKNRGIPGDLIRMSFQWTGGYPEAMDAVIEMWERNGGPDLRKEYVLTLRTEAERSLARLAKLLDPKGEERYRKLVGRLHQREEEQESFQTIKRFHPWSGILLDEDGLRADSLGDVVVRIEFEKALQGDEFTSPMNRAESLARTYYDRGQYDLTCDVLQRAWAEEAPPRVGLLREHASIMDALRGGMADSQPDVDCDWRSVIRHVDKAAEILPTVDLDSRLSRQLMTRYEDLRVLAASVRCGSEGGDCRVIDSLAGLRGARNVDTKTAFTLLVLHAEAGRRIRGNSAACKVVLEMPEQLLRIWAFCKIRVNYYEAPMIEGDVPTLISQIWPEKTTSVSLPREGESFSGISVFAHYLFAMQTAGRMPTAVAWLDRGSFDADMAVMQQRNDTAHAVSVMNAGMRKRMFATIDKWLAKIEGECQVGISYRQTLEQFEALPVL